MVEIYQGFQSSKGFDAHEMSMLLIVKQKTT